jgi:hypothetical protein
MRIPKPFLLLLEGLLLAASLLLAFTSAASPAFAATTPPASLSAIAVTPSPTSLSAVNAVGEVIICNSNIYFSIASGHAYAEGLVLCTEDVEGITITASLFRNGNVADQDGDITLGEKHAGALASHRCTSSYHNWQAYLTGVIQFPDGYIPASASIFLFTPVVREHC